MPIAMRCTDRAARVCCFNRNRLARIARTAKQAYSVASLAGNVRNNDAALLDEISDYPKLATQLEPVQTAPIANHRRQCQRRTRPNAWPRMAGWAASPH